MVDLVEGLNEALCLRDEEIKILKHGMQAEIDSGAARIAEQEAKIIRMTEEGNKLADLVEEDIDLLDGFEDLQQATIDRLNLEIKNLEARTKGMEELLEAGRKTTQVLIDRLAEYDGGVTDHE